MKIMMKMVKEKVMDLVKKMKKNGEEDPRRIVHSFKVGLALTLMSLFYYFRPLYHGFGEAGMWAILTVVVVFEFSVGGTISKGLNRGAATLLAAGLGVGAEYLAMACGERGEPIVLGLLVFLLAAGATFVRFIPSVKRRYDYGVMIFILTFTLVAVSGARAAEIWKMAHQRLTTILIGGATCMVISLCICPVWAGQDLHNLIAGNIEKIAVFLEGFGGQFCNSTGKDGDKAYLQSHKSVLNSKANEEALANFAWWELGHGRFKFNHPWKLYLNIGSLARQCACQIETLSGCKSSNSKASTNSRSIHLHHFSMQTNFPNKFNFINPQLASAFHQEILPACERMSLESSKALRELAAGMKNKTFPSPVLEIHLQNCKAAADELKNIMENCPLPTKADVNEIVPVLVAASVLIDVFRFVEEISVSVRELSRKAGFKEVKLTADASDKQEIRQLHRGIVKPDGDQESSSSNAGVDIVCVSIMREKERVYETMYISLFTFKKWSS